MPPMTPEGAAANGGVPDAVRRQRLGRSVQRPRGPQPLRSLHHARRDRLDDAGRSTATATRSCRRPGYVAIRYEMIHETRVIPLDGRPHVGQSIRTYMGDARGHWEGNTLVVETTNFNGQDRRHRQRPRHVHSDACGWSNASRASIADTIQYEVTIDDPTTWTRPWTFAMHADEQDPQYGDVRVRLPRGQLRAAEHPQRRARRRRGSGRK